MSDWNVSGGFYAPPAPADELCDDCGWQRSQHPTTVCSEFKPSGARASTHDDTGMGTEEDALRALCGEAAAFMRGTGHQYSERGNRLWQRLHDAALGHDVRPARSGRRDMSESERKNG